MPVAPQSLTSNLVIQVQRNLRKGRKRLNHYLIKFNVGGSISDSGMTQSYYYSNGVVHRIYFTLLTQYYLVYEISPISYYENQIDLYGCSSLAKAQ